MAGEAGKREDPAPLVIADVRRRVIADVIDGVLVLLLLMMLALLLESAYYASGPYGRLISYGIVVAYFTVFSSAYGKGQTPGKRFTGITVRNAQGHYLTVGQAMARSSALVAIFLFNRWDIPMFITSPVLAVLANAVLLGGIAAILFSYVRGHETRQTPHDMLVRSYVVLKPYPFEPLRDYVLPERPSQYVKSMMGWLIAGVMVAAVMSAAFMDSDLVALEKALNNTGQFFSVQASRNADQLTIWAWYDEQVDEERCYRLARTLMQDVYGNYGKLDAINQIEVRVFRGIDLMINDMPDTMCAEAFRVNR